MNLRHTGSTCVHKGFPKAAVPNGKHEQTTQGHKISKESFQTERDQSKQSEKKEN
jgi:hypothetical protein